ncbi:MAG: 3-hydroxybutyryl-CoA dehydrogenase [Deltaproteobacteria bacterium]|nr:3-hydroxybutyryl-CoA dehydrogenase [Deltaproteobacteria bacterium]
MKKIAVLGAGLMGSGIAQVAAQAGFDVNLMDVAQQFVDKGLSTIEKNLKRMAEKGKMEPAQAEAVRKRINPFLSLADAAKDVDVVIEAVIEKMDLKKGVYTELEAAARKDTLFASNTSALSITELASATKRPDRFIGMHFFNPVPVMQLVEIIRGYGTSDQTVAVIKQLTEKMGKTGIEVQEAPGFVVNRILVPMIIEAIFALQEGLATPEEIDTGMRLGANHPMGPLALADLVGLDTLLNVQQNLYEEFADPKYRPPALLRKMVRAGHLGRKSGKGFYNYT